MRRSMLKYWLI